MDTSLHRGVGGGLAFLEATLRAEVALNLLGSQSHSQPFSEDNRGVFHPCFWRFGDLWFCRFFRLDLASRDRRRGAALPFDDRLSSDSSPRPRQVAADKFAPNPDRRGLAQFDLSGS